MVLSGANAAIFVAELENPYPTPPRIIVSWEEATDEQKERLNWFTVDGEKIAFEAISETYRQEIEKEHLENVYNFLLEDDSGIYALEYYNRNKDKFEKYGAKVNLNIPICKYEEDHQCRFDCPIFGVCEKNPC